MARFRRRPSGENFVATQDASDRTAGVALPTTPRDRSAGHCRHFLVNETTGQTLHFAVDAGFPPAVTVDAGVSRSGAPDQPPDFNPPARFGAVYFDDISIFTTAGPVSLTAGAAVSMVEENGAILATPVTLTDCAFKVVRDAARPSPARSGAVGRPPVA